MRICISPLLVIVIEGGFKQYGFPAPWAIAASNIADRRGSPLLVMEKRSFCQKGMRIIVCRTILWAHISNLRDALRFP
jgi:hypothetical protein